MKLRSSRNDDTLICDTGPLLALARIEFLPIVYKLFTHCLVTNAVLAECTAKPQAPDAVIIQTAVDDGALRVLRTPSIRIELAELDAGEQSVLEIALRRNAIALLDEKRGRVLARQVGIRVLGTLGTILLAKEQRHIERVSPYLERLVESGYYLGQDLIARCRNLAGE